MSTHRLSTKYDWPAAWMLFCAGAELEEVAGALNIPIAAVRDYSARHHWKHRRTTALATATKAVSEKLKKRVERHRITHQNFILDQLEETQEVLEEIGINKPGEKDESKISLGGKLSLIEQHDNLARRTLRLDEEDKSQDPTQMGFMVLIATQNQPNLVNESLTIPAEVVEMVKTNDGSSEVKSVGEEGKITHSAMMVLPEQTEAFTGILGPFNGHNNGQHQPTETANKGFEPETGQPGSEELPTQPYEPGQERTPMPRKIGFMKPKPVTSEESLVNEKAKP